MKISKLRRKLKKKEYVEFLLDQYIAESEHWYRFYEFECSSFFKGYSAALANTRIYNLKAPRVDRHVEFLSKLLEEL